VGWLALAGVSLIAGIASYFHALAVVQAAGATAPVAYLVPALADLVILGASADLLAASRAGQPRPRLAMVALGVGVVVTVAMNIAAGSGHGLGGRLVAGWPALAFVLALESLGGLVRRGRGGDSPNPVPATSSRCPHGVAASADEAIRLDWEHRTACLGEQPSQRQHAATWGVSRAKVAALVGPPAAEPSLNGASGR
jgi:hypothetical protein